MSVHALSLSPTHTFTKHPTPTLTLLPGLGVKGDCHSGEHVQHRSRLHIRPLPPNLRQVHLIAKETLDGDCAAVGDGVPVQPGELGENVTTVGVDLLKLGRGARLHFLPVDTASGTGTDVAGDGEVGVGMEVPHAVVVVQGLRNPCPQIDKFRAGLKERLIVRDAERKIVGRKAGVMGTVEQGGEVSVGMRIVVKSEGEFEELECV